MAKKVLVVKTRLNAFLKDIHQVISKKRLYYNLSSFDNATSNSLFKTR